MAKRFDSSTKQLVQSRPADWLALAGLEARGEIEVIEADVSTHSGAADKVLRVGGAHPYIGHVELQAGPDLHLDLRVLMYNSLLRWRLRLPVRSVAVLLHPRAQPPAVTGAVQDVSDPLAPLDFRYRLVRVWELPVDMILSGGIGTLPLVPLTAVTLDDLPPALKAMEQRLAREVPPPEAWDLLTASFVLAGLRFPKELVKQLLQGVRHMKESSTYQAILEEGADRGRAEGLAQGQADGARTLLLRLGERRFGPPDRATLMRIAQITELSALESLAERLDEAHDWEELLEAQH